MKKLILLFALPSLFLTACQEQNNEQINEQTKAASMKVNVVQVQPVTLTQTLRLSGSITAKEDVAVGTALLGLQIQTVNVDVGDVVKKGAGFGHAETLSNFDEKRCHKPSGVGATTGESPCHSCGGSGGEQVVQKAGALINERDRVEPIVK